MLGLEAFGVNAIIFGVPSQPEILIENGVTLPIRFSNSKKEKKERKKEKKERKKESVDGVTSSHSGCLLVANPDVLLSFRSVKGSQRRGCSQRRAGALPRSELAM